MREIRQFFFSRSFPFDSLANEKSRVNSRSLRSYTGFLLFKFEFQAQTYFTSLSYRSSFTRYKNKDTLDATGRSLPRVRLSSGTSVRATTMTRWRS